MSTLPYIVFVSAMSKVARFIVAFLLFQEPCVRSFVLNKPAHGPSLKYVCSASRHVLSSKPKSNSQQDDYELERLVDWVTKTEASRPVIREYKPDAWWLWTRWDGSVRKIAITPVVFTIAINISIMVWADDDVIQQLDILKTPWEYLLTLCTLILSFFTSQAYAHWQKVYGTTRAIQGRINDICLLLVLGAERKDSTFTDEAKNLLDVCTRLLRVSHVLFWAATPTSASTDRGGDDFVKHGERLLSPQGLERLVDQGQLTREELESLEHTGLPSTQYPYILFEWVGVYAMEGLRESSLSSSNQVGLEENLLKQFTALRAEYFNIGDYKAGRMPLAYVQLVQILIDWLVYLAPFALVDQLGAVCTPLTALFALFFKGLLELSKSFLDPFGDEGYPGQNIRVDVLVAEMNYALSRRWVKAGERLPPVIQNVQERDA